MKIKILKKPFHFIEHTKTIKKCQRIFTSKMYPNQDIAISVFQNPGGTQKQKVLKKLISLALQI